MSKAMCALCSDVIESASVHDYVTCKCGEIFLDGGDAYLRYGAHTTLDNVVILESADAVLVEPPIRKSKLREDINHNVTVNFSSPEMNKLWQQAQEKNMLATEYLRWLALGDKDE